MEQRSTGQLWTARIDGSGARQLTFDDRDLGMPAFSPDGKSISFMMGADDPLKKVLHVYTIQSDGGNRVQLIPGGKREQLPDILKGINPFFGWVSFSFDDRQILFVKSKINARGVLIENLFE